MHARGKNYVVAINKFKFKNIKIFWTLNSLEVHSRACHNRINVFATDCRPSREKLDAVFETH